MDSTKHGVGKNISQVKYAQGEGLVRFVIKQESNNNKNAKGV